MNKDDDKNTNKNKYRSSEDYNNVNHGYFVDFNSLYPSVLETELPYKNFLLLEKEENSPQFTYLAKQLQNTNIDFFVRQAQKYKRSFLFEVKITYDFEQSIFNSICLNAFPFFKKINISDLAKDQQAYLFAQGKSKFCPQKLVSTHEDRVLVEYIDCLIYMITHHHCQIVDVLSVVVFETSNYMKPYIQYLQDQRASATSPLQKRIIKMLGNWLVSTLRAVMCTRLYYPLCCSIS